MKNANHWLLAIVSAISLDAHSGFCATNANASTPASPPSGFSFMDSRAVNPSYSPSLPDADSANPAAAPAMAVKNMPPPPPAPTVEPASPESSANTPASNPPLSAQAAPASGRQKIFVPRSSKIQE